MIAQLRESNGPFPKPGYGCFVPPKDVLQDVFPPAVRQKWRKKPNKDLTDRLNILCATGPWPSDPRLRRDVQLWKARRAAWEAYLFTSYACGLFEGSRGKELRGGLRGRGEKQFRAAMAECMACWVLAGKHKLPCRADAPGRGGHNLDMRVQLSGQEVGIEVKSPFKARPESVRGMTHIGGDDSDKFRQAMHRANNQFTDDCPNILVLIPYVRFYLSNLRSDLVKATFGETVITTLIHPETGDVGPTSYEFDPNGCFLNTHHNGRGLKADGLPAYRRISAIMCLEETQAPGYGIRYVDRMWIEHNALVMHNPFAYFPISHERFSMYPQFIPENGQMRWTDGGQ